MAKAHHSSREAKKKALTTHKEKKAVRKAKKDAKETRPPLITQ